ncbi:hypothetical protein [Ekhidna sp.]|uniref:hypothetical protein n=1 Tax=Ekhidna sp. TaxID=2608089 RepID=UPI00329870B3
MTREEQVAFCKKCTNREMSMDGLICQLTGKKAEFEGTCDDFNRDESVKDEIKQDDRKTTEVIADLKSSDRDKLIPHQDLFYAIIGGLFSAIISALIWAVITVTAEYQIGFMAIGVGLAVGMSVRFFGAGIEQIYGIIGAFFALFGCLLGNIFSQIGFIAQFQQMSYWDALLLMNFETIILIFKDTFSFIDLVFYAIAVGEGYKFAFRPVPEDISQIEDAEPANTKLRKPLVIGCFLIISASIFALSQGVSGTQTFYYENGNMESQGNMEDGLEEGEWTYFYESGRPYLTGSFIKGVENSSWTWFYESGQVMRQGNYVNGLFDGEIIDYNPEGVVVTTSNYESGRLNGPYKQYFDSGDLQQDGLYVRDRQEGEWKLYYQDGTLNATISLKDGELHGESKVYNADGSPLREFRYEGDKISHLTNLWNSDGEQIIIDGNGRFKSYHENGKLQEEGNVKDGKRVGNWTSYHPSGRKLSIGYYEKDQYVMQNAWDTSGNLMVQDGTGSYVTFFPDSASEQEKGDIKGGLRSGIWYLYYPNSIILQMEQEFKNGKLNGQVTSYYQSGGYQASGAYDEDKKVGLWTWYYETGGVSSTVNYVNGKKNGEQFFYSELGKKVKVETYKDGDLISEELVDEG